jgi:anti-sigma-K factor RskA
MSEQQMTHEQALELAAGYVLGALEPAEEAAVRRHLRTCAESHAGFAELGGVVPYLVDGPELELIEPPPGLRDRIMAAAAADLAARGAIGTAQRAAPSAATAAPPASEPAPIPFPPASERAIPRRTSGFDWVLRIAAVIAIVALGAWNFQLRGQVTDLQDQAGAARDYERAVAAVLDVAGQPGSQTAVLAAQKPGDPRGIAAVALNGSIQLALQDLAPTTGSQVYETWAIVPDQAPIPLGSFTVGATGTAAFTSRPGPATPGIVVALSREPAAGATTPTEVVSVGAATAPPG